MLLRKLVTENGEKNVSSALSRSTGKIYILIRCKRTNGIFRLPIWYFKIYLNVGVICKEKSLFCSNQERTSSRSQVMQIVFTVRTVSYRHYCVLTKTSLYY